MPPLQQLWQIFKQQQLQQYVMFEQQYSPIDVLRFGLALLLVLVCLQSRSVLGFAENSVTL